MAKRVDKWLSKEGLALIGGWRRQGFGEAEIAVKMGISESTLERWKGGHEEICRALLIDRETANYMVEDVLFSKSLAGDQKAYEFWLKHRMPGKWGKGAGKEDGAAGDGVVRLAELINNPVERPGDVE